MFCVLKIGPQGYGVPFTLQMFSLWTKTPYQCLQYIGWCSRSEQPPTASKTTIAPSLMRASQSIPLSSTSMFVDTRTPVFLQTARTAVYNPDTPMVTHNTHILFDSGSQRSYIVSRVQDILHLPTERVESLAVKTFGSEIERPQGYDLVNLCVKVKRGVDITVPLLTVPTICEPLCGQPIIRALKLYCYLSKLDLADYGAPNDSLDVGILIGADLYWSFITGRARQGSGLTAIETKLGWVLSGPATGLCPEIASMNLLSCHTLKAETSLVTADNTTLNQTLKMFWDLEAIV